ncbi:type III secretion system inner rod protein MxiI [Escherichia coli O28ac]|uniref:Protein MxiI n=15 Tax=Enterobacteriaceae TaxID=543 RepID=MXII_SHIFL|nr:MULTISPECIES: type III secretion system inner rod protein MxiI [Enterobacteriaceae]NP_858271.1 Mxi-Spa secretion machinery protein MxiI [Shigella flexneri 2a str. 301]P0A225.1 RecName: Full=Protein MxiI [Shigella flexneri]P0A226.1 RecName: Full=Protein MxiI [Shigella sonnei]8AXK_M Chain M, Protein MxiI [Shigella flexneri]8AXK_N Chain N, Protein MxiI [Shigella flexneri]8AXK_O Chain O, Protein MxiI [Shigella flexneri]8AXK_P Chain P, Protein MxiI [Shigella flexneri]8AXK_Q Chain Q, Protein M
MNYIYPVNQVDIIKASDFQSQEISSLEDVVSAKYSDIKMDTDIQVSQIMEMVSNPESLNPESLAKLQTTLSNYSIGVSLAGTLARKTVSAVETLLKS